MTNNDRKIEAQNQFLAGEHIVSIAKSIGVSRRTIERWADEGAWREKRDNVVSINQPRVQPARRRRSSTIDELELVEIALSDISTAMATARSEDIRAIGTLATGLVKLLEYRRKVLPPTAAELAELAIGLNLSPQDFITELKKQGWQQRA